MSVSDVYYIQCETMVADVPCKFGLHYRHSSGPAAAFPANDLVAAWYTAVSAALFAVLSSSTTLMRIIGRPLDPAFGPPYEANYDTTHVGTNGAVAMDPAVAMLIKFKTNSPLSKNNGHAYIAGIPDTAWVFGNWEAGAFLPLVATLITALKAPIVGASGANYVPCVVSRYLANIKRVPPVTFDIVDATLATNSSQQNRRESGYQGIHT